MMLKCSIRTRRYQDTEGQGCLQRDILRILMIHKEYSMGVNDEDRIIKNKEL